MQYLRNTAVLLLWISFFSTTVAQQNIQQLSLQEVIHIAQQQSNKALLAKHTFRRNYWQFRSFKAELMPLLQMNSSLPGYSQSINQINTGSFDYVSQKYSRSQLGLSLSENIGLTGGNVFISSNMVRFHDYLSDENPTTYTSIPVFIGISQPLFGYNQYRWSKKIEPLRYQEAQQKYLEEVEDVALTATDYYFDLLKAQINLKIQENNQANNDTLYKIAMGRYNIGTIAENELLQLELSLLKSNAQLEQSRLDLQTKQFRLRSFLRLQDDVQLNLIPPTKIPEIIVNPQEALSLARENSSEAISYDRRLFEAHSRVVEAKLSNRFSANLTAEYGLTQSAFEIEQAYKNPGDQQKLNIGLSVPILDWGRAKGKIKMAESEEELVKTGVEQDKSDFNQDIYLKVMNFNMQANQLRIADKSDKIALKRYTVTKQRYMIGKISITDLNIAQTEKDNARLGYFDQLKNFWKNYYTIRQITLYDFENKKPLEVDFSKIYQ